FTNLELIKDLEQQKKSIALMCAHYSSYEWIISLNKFIDFKGYAIYKKINNPYFDDLVRKIRLRFKANLITTKETIPVIEENYKKNILGIYGFASDQSPQLHSARYWKDFLGINVPVYTGAEMLAKKFDMNVVFLRTKKIKRGHYEATFEILAKNVKEIPDYEITDKFLNLVEKQILEAPEFYFWTHKRWKHAGKNPNLQTTI
ncbi:MAG: lysophospholipid acyltransferase family protein, partial [Flavobacterium sp.]|nr:lysophospholipid acyltransferase family protein [Flavobacterium sp.]